MFPKKGRAWLDILLFVVCYLLVSLQKGVCFWVSLELLGLRFELHFLGLDNS